MLTSSPFAIRHSQFSPEGAAAAERLPLLLCYHKIEPRHELGVTRLSPRRFARQVERLAKAGYVGIGVEDLLAIIRGERACGEREVLFTFDDAYRGLRDHAFPVLAAHGWPALCFVITDYAGKLNRWDVAYGGRRFAHLAWRDIRRWEGRGIAFASHTATHPRLTWLPDDAVAGELERSRLAMEAGCDAPAPVISYPFGAAGRREFTLARAAGYEAGMTLAHPWRRDPMAIPRLPVYLWSPPAPGIGILRPLEWLAAAGANRASVGTSVMKGV